MNLEPSTNPYSAPAGTGELMAAGADSAESDFSHRRSWPKSLGIWTLVCTVSAAPSFFLGLATVAPQQALAMLLGIAIFIVGYTVADQLTQDLPWRRNKSVRLTLRIGYISRLLISVVIPVGGMLDMFCGIISVEIVQTIFPNSGYLETPDSMRFLPALLTTLVQGGVLNVVLAGYMGVVFCIVLLLSGLRTSSDPELTESEL